MGWDDIDFNLIKTGMITRGPAAVSFSEYLNTFCEALDERYNMVVIRNDSDSKTPPNIRFELGEIRNNDFWDKYRDMLNEYYLLYSQYDWYEVEVVDNLSEPDSYLIDDAMLIANIGQEAFDALSDPYNASFNDIFKASVLNGIYSMYEYLTIKKTSNLLRVDSEDPDEVPVNSVSSYRDIKDIYESSGFGVGEDQSEASSEYDDDYAAFNQGSFNYSQMFWLSSLESRYSKTSNPPPSTDEYRYNMTNTINNISLFYLAYDINDTVLSMDFYISKCRLEDNHISLTQDGSTDIESAWDSRYPTVKNSSSTYIAPSPDSVSQTTLGTNNKYALNGNVTDPDIPLLAFPTSESGNRFAEFKVIPAAVFLADVNNASLEFYIAP